MEIPAKHSTLNCEESMLNDLLKSATVSDTSKSLEMLSNMLLNGLEGRLGFSLTPFKRHIIIKESASVLFCGENSGQDAFSLEIEGLISIRLKPRIDIVANILIFSYGERLVIPGEIEKSFLSIDFDVNSSLWGEAMWRDDEFGEFESIIRVRSDLYKLQQFTEE